MWLNCSMMKRRILIGSSVLRIVQYGPLRWSAHQFNTKANCFFNSWDDFSLVFFFTRNLFASCLEDNFSYMFTDLT